MLTLKTFHFRSLEIAIRRLSFLADLKFLTYHLGEEIEFSHMSYTRHPCQKATDFQPSRLQFVIDYRQRNISRLMIRMGRLSDFAE